MGFNRNYNNKILLLISLLVNIVLIIYTIVSSKRGTDKTENIYYVQLVETPRIAEQHLSPLVGTKYTQRGEFWVLKNYIMATETFAYNESITFCTHGDFSYLDNLVPLLERWNGPISISLYTPGTDFDEALFRILYLRECGESHLVKKLVNFHFYFEQKHFPKKNIPTRPSWLAVNCSSTNEPLYHEDIKSYKHLKKLTYPINIGRNVAREMATTKYVLSADIELYPNPNLIPSFLNMIKMRYSFNDTTEVFVLPIFEVESYITELPDNKQDLIFMLRNDSAVPFHQYVCSYCHKIPNETEWTAAVVQDPLVDKVFYTGKRQGNFSKWEPIYIASNDVPFYDERLNREGLRDKMTQGYILCALDYNFHILNNAFLIHRPGIKRIFNENKEAKPFIKRQNRIIDGSIKPQIKSFYGNVDKCEI